MVTISYQLSGDGWAFPVAMEETDLLAAPAEASKEDSGGGEP